VLASAGVPSATAVPFAAPVLTPAAVTTSPVLRRGRIGGRNRQRGCSSDEQLRPTHHRQLSREVAHEQLGRTHHRQLSREFASEIKRKDANWHSVIVSQPRRSG
jgi:hypothetical protein